MRMNVDVNNTNNNLQEGWTALSRAVQKGHTDMVDFLLESGATCNIQNIVSVTDKRSYRRIGLVLLFFKVTGAAAPSDCVVPTTT